MNKNRALYRSVGDLIIYPALLSLVQKPVVNDAQRPGDSEARWRAVATILACLPTN